jgi:hypothetical protein
VEGGDLSEEKGRPEEKLVKQERNADAKNMRKKYSTKHE